MIQGIDCSHHNRRFNWDKAKAEGVRFAFIRAMFGYTRDTEFDRNWSEAKRVGIARGAYGWALHNMNQKTLAKLFVNRWINDPGELPPVVDYENTKWHGKATFEELRLFMDEVYRLSGLHPIIYTSKGAWNSVPKHSEQLWALNHHLWVANYTLSSQPSMPSVWKTSGTPWTFWQYTSHGDGYKYGSGGKNLDLNWFNGSEEEFADYVKGDIQPAPLPEQVIVICNKLSFRSRPEIYSGDRPYIPKGTVCKVLEKVTTDIDWYNVELSGGDKGFISAGFNYVRAL